MRLPFFIQMQLAITVWVWSLKNKLDALLKLEWNDWWALYPKKYVHLITSLLFTNEEELTSVGLVSKSKFQTLLSHLVSSFVNYPNQPSLEHTAKVSLNSMPLHSYIRLEGSNFNSLNLSHTTKLIMQSENVKVMLSGLWYCATNQVLSAEIIYFQTYRSCY